MVQAEILNLVKARIENTDRGRELLEKQLKLIRKLKTKIINDTNMEMELFKKFKEYSKNNPTVTYEEFIKKGI
jgi:DNA-binding PadR family transcriptional regulator